MSEPVPYSVAVSALGYTDRQVRALAADRSKRMRGIRSTYRLSTFTSNYVGALGELAAHRWFLDRGTDVTASYLRAHAHGDLRVVETGMTVEVKTSRAHWWAGRGAMVSAAQLATIRDVDALMWCVVDDDPPGTEVRIVGWIPVPDLVERVRPTVIRGNTTLRISHLDDLSTIPTWMDAHRDRFTWTRKAALYECTRGHDGFFSVCLQCWRTGLGGPANVLLEPGRRVYHRDVGCRAGTGYTAEVMAADALQKATGCPVCVTGWLEGLAGDAG